MKKRLLYILFFYAFFTVGCSDKSGKPDPEQIINIVKINAPSLKNSIALIDTIQRAKVFLPPFYNSNPDIRYPVVYFIHGYGDSYQNDYGIFQAAYDAMVAGSVKEFFIVCVNSTCVLGGTFCANSPVTGNWETHIADEVVAFMDANYRTIPNKESRGIAGFSMGGFGALYLGLRHADIYNLVFSFSPGVLKEEDFKGAYNLWGSDGSFITAYGATFSPNLETGYPHAEKPLFNGTEQDSLVIENWKNGFSFFDKKVNNYLASTPRLKRIALDYGSTDYYGWIPRGCVFLANIFEEKNIPYDIHPRSPGAHEVNINTVKGYMLPFFSENFSYEQ